MKMQKYNILLPILLLVCVNQLKAQTIKKISLQQAVELGLQSSKNLKIDSAKILESTAAIENAKNNQLPDLKLSGSYMRLTSAKIDMKMNKGEASSAENNSGGSVPSPKEAMYGLANLSLPLYAGGKIRYGIQSAKYLLEATRLSTVGDKNAIAYNLIQAYTNLFKASQVIQVIKENLQASQSRDSNFINLENNGLLARNDRLKAQLQTSDIELQLLEAENDYTIANVNMDLLLGLPENTILETDSSFINDPIDQQPFAYYEEQALQNRKDLQAIDYQQKSAQLNVKIARADYMPSIALTGGYVAADIPKIFSVVNAINVGVGIQYSLSSLWKANASVKQAKAKQTELSATRELTVDGIKLDLNKDYQNALVAKRKIDVYRKSVAQAIENYRITKNKYDNSLVTITDLLDANVALLSSRINMLNAKADAALAYQKLLGTAGILYK